MKKLIFAALIFTHSLFSWEWIPIAKQTMDVKKECLFYDAWNDRIVFGVPQEYIVWEYHNERVVVITHWMPLERPYDKIAYLNEIIE